MECVPILVGTHSFCQYIFFKISHLISRKLFFKKMIVAFPLNVIPSVVEESRRNARAKRCLLEMR
jgi:hypothetical protein